MGDFNDGSGFYGVDDYDKARAERDFNMNPPSTAPGQGSDDEWGNIFSGASMSSSSNDMALMGGGSDINAILNSNATQGQQGMQQNGNKSWGDTAEEFATKAAVELGKGSASYAKNLIESFRNNSPADWSKLFRMYMFQGAGVAGIGLFLCLLSIFVPDMHYTGSILVGGLLATVIGFSDWYFLLEKRMARQRELDAIEEDNASQVNDLMPRDDVFDIEDDNSSWDDMNLDEDVDDNEDDLGEWGDMEDLDEPEDDIVEVEDVPLDVEGALAELPEITPGTQTRQFLFESFSKVLPTMCPDFYEMREIFEDDNRFMDFAQYVTDAAEQVGTPEEKIPMLLRMYENPFIIQLVTERPPGLKEQEIANEIANVYSRDNAGVVVKTGSYATIDPVIGELHINIFKCDEIMISLGDTYRVIGDFVKDPKVRMPMVWGINEKGKVLYCDAYDTFSTIISGVPRSGKSWKGQSLLLQLAMFSSPKEVHFHIFDKKAKTSDYDYAAKVLPHVVEFCGNYKLFNERIANLINKEVEKRNKILEEHSCVSIKDLKEKCPDIDMPYIYIVIDELMGLMNVLSKEEKQEFSSLMSVLVSELPSRGFRLILFPHRIVNDIISKDIYSLVSCRACVRKQDFEELKSEIGASKKNFPYSLVNMGDMGVRNPDIANGVPSFCHAEVITGKNERNQRIFQYVGDVWRKLEPDYCADLEEKFIYISENGSAPKVNSDGVVKDNSVSSVDYDYKGYASATDMVESLGDDVDDVSEDAFWDDIIKE